jgi:hypothetical protein
LRPGELQAEALLDDRLDRVEGAVLAAIFLEIGHLVGKAWKDIFWPVSTS